ncbi:hypothetical protein CVT24_009922 [Panaeolus cyanescens]|uniref:Uncharacterized protein n=1 Tax=Panaeolus cyanescens TaxID=181874 RepID=A0A409WU35_9AGAR|nr:hypothetical protein CVT24_009922 [Panaeolus cyanescens]
MAFTSATGPYKKSRRDNSIISNASHKILLQNHNEAYTQLYMDNSRLQIKYDMLWECYQSLVQQINFEHTSSMPKVFDSSILIPEVVPDSQPSSPYPGRAGLIRVEKTSKTSPTSSFTPHKPTAELCDVLQALESSPGSASSRATTSGITDLDLDPDWLTFRRVYEDRRRANFNTRLEVGSGSSLEQRSRAKRLEEFFEEMDQKYPYH